MTVHRNLLRLMLATSCASGLACGNAEGGNISASSAGDSFGSIRFSVAPGAGAKGLMPGKGERDVIDGWTVEYEKVLVTLGVVTALQGGAEHSMTSRSYILDLRQTPDRGSELQLTELAAGDYEELRFSVVDPADDSLVVDGVDTDKDLMRKNGYTIYVEGSMSNPSGQSCKPTDPAVCTPTPKIRFRWGVAAPTEYSGCTGFTVLDRETLDVVVSLAMDHWFFTSFAPSAEDSPRRAQWIADADINGDGETTIEELRSISAVDLFRPELGYDLNRAPGKINTAEDFVTAQARTIGISGATGCDTALPLE